MDTAADHTVLIAFLATGAAVLAAVIAAVSADTRQRRQLRHDRRLHDLTELRSVLDEATVALQAAIHELQWAWTGFGSQEMREKQPRRVRAKLEQLRDEDYRTELRKCSEARDRMIFAGQRIAIRLGHDAALNSTYGSAIDVVIKAIRKIAEAKRIEGAGTQASPEDFQDLQGELIRLRQLFVMQAVARVGSQLP